MFDRAVIVALGLACAAAPLPARSEPPAARGLSPSANAEPPPPDIVLVSPAAQGHYQRGIQEFDAGRYHDAILELDAAYVIEQHPELLYARAQARRLAGECSSALKLYEYFLATSPPAKQLRNANENIERCRAALSTGEPPPEARPVAPEPPPRVEGPPPPPLAPLPPPARKDIPGGVLTGVGGVLTGTGLGMLLGAMASTASLTAPTQMQFDQRYQQLRGVYLGGAVVLGVGLGLLVGGITRYAVVARKRRQLAAAR